MIQELRQNIARMIAPKKTTGLDSFVNPAANIGGGGNGLATNLLAAGTYEFDKITQNQILLRAAYRGSWVIAKAVDGVAEDMTKAGIEPFSDIDPLLWRRIEAEAEKLELWHQLCDWIRWGRLFGGAILVPMIDGQDPSTPLNLDSIGIGQVQGFDVYDRWRLIPDTSHRIKAAGRNRGLYEYYQTVADGQGTPNLRIHYTRCIRFDGSPLPHFERIANFMWGMSIVERIFKAILAYDSTTTGAAQLALKAHLRTLKVPGLFDARAGNSVAWTAIMKRVQDMRLFQTSEGITVLDAEEQMEHFTQTFAGLDNLMVQMATQVCGAIEYPQVKLFGKSASGLNASDEWALENYNQELQIKQNTMLRHHISLLYDIISRSAIGQPLPDDFMFGFKHLSVPDQEKRAGIATAVINSILAAYASGLISERTALLELRQSSNDTGLFTNITDDDINDADTIPPKAELPTDDNDEGGDNGNDDDDERDNESRNNDTRERDKGAQSD